MDHVRIFEALASIREQARQHAPEHWRVTVSVSYQAGDHDRDGKRYTAGGEIIISTGPIGGEMHTIQARGPDPAGALARFADACPTADVCPHCRRPVAP